MHSDYYVLQILIWKLISISGCFRCFRDPNQVPRIENGVPKIRVLSRELNYLNGYEVHLKVPGLWLPKQLFKTWTCYRMLFSNMKGRNYDVMEDWKVFQKFRLGTLNYFGTILPYLSVLSLANYVYHGWLAADWNPTSDPLLCPTFRNICWKSTNLRKPVLRSHDLFRVALKSSLTGDISFRRCH